MSPCLLDFKLGGLVPNVTWKSGICVEVSFHPSHHEGLHESTVVRKVMLASKKNLKVEREAHHELGFAAMSSHSLENDWPDDMLFEITDFLAFNEEFQDAHLVLPSSCHQSPAPTPILQANENHVNKTGASDCSENKNVVTTTSRGSSTKVAFKTKTELDVLDDGYKWRKYGKKMLKDSPNPRNYFRCSSEGCKVKKRVEREREDSSYVITTYEGVHNHPAPSPATS